MEEKNEVSVISTESSGESRCGFKLDAKSGLIGAGIVIAGLGLFKAGNAIKQKFGKGKVEEETTEPEDEEDPDTEEATEEEASKETK